MDLLLQNLLLATISMILYRCFISANYVLAHIHEFVDAHCLFRLMYNCMDSGPYF